MSKARDIMNIQPLDWNKLALKMRGYIIRDLSNRNKTKAIKVLGDIVQNKIDTYHKSKDININIG